jgi:hypothetical protein
MAARTTKKSTQSTAQSTAAADTAPAIAATADNNAPLVSRSELSAEWQRIVAALEVGSTQLLVRLEALATHEQIGPEAVLAYAGWVARVQRALDSLPKE